MQFEFVSRALPRRTTSADNVFHECTACSRAVLCAILVLPQYARAAHWMSELVELPC